MAGNEQRARASEAGFDLGTQRTVGALPFNSVTDAASCSIRVLRRHADQSVQVGARNAQAAGGNALAFRHDDGFLNNAFQFPHITGQSYSSRSAMASIAHLSSLL